jgi:hypothetical protein
MNQIWISGIIFLIIKLFIMKNKKSIFLLSASIGAASVYAISHRIINATTSNNHTRTAITYTATDDEQAPCVFMTLMGEQSSVGFDTVKQNEKYHTTIQRGEAWLIAAQNKDGGWGAGLRSSQKVRNPHAVASDPATTAMAAMALYRCGYHINNGAYKEQLLQALNYLLQQVNTSGNDIYITKVRGTQIQGKLGEHIDAVLTLQFLNQIIHTIEQPSLKDKVHQAIQVCVNKLEQSMDDAGKITGSGWAGVLQSSFANASLETAAKVSGVKVDTRKIQLAREYQKSNYNAENENVNTKEGAGIMLYAVSSSVRGSAAEHKEAKAVMKKAKDDGLIEHDAAINEQNLKRIGVSDEKAKSYDVANKVYQSAKVKAMQEDVLSGFGNNGGEEFLSFLQTGESMVLSKDEEWVKWYDNIGGRIMKIQNNDGSWHGHHCITSPVFCTATCLMILSIENDIVKLQH